MKINIQYFALLKEQRGLNQETLATNAKTAKELYQELQAKYKFKISTDLLKVAVNNEYKDWNTQLHSDDTIVFIPPVAGG
jgi:molybdopterin converting factor subunit 1